MSLAASPIKEDRATTQTLGVQPETGDVAIPHACEPETVPDTQDRGSTKRLMGVDVARAVALVGMIAVHLLPPESDGAMSWSFVLFSGKSAALFAVLAGVGIALSTGRSRPPRGRHWLAAAASVMVRALLITLIGLALGSVIPSDSAFVILVSYGVMFLLAVPLLRLKPAALAAIASVIAIGMPVLSHVLRQDLPASAATNPSFASLVQAPGATVRDILLTGTFPALSWMAYVVAGLAVGRLALHLRGAMLRLVAIGVSVAIVANAVSWYLMDRMGGLAALAGAAAPIMSREDFADTLVWGAEGTLPTNSPWWLGVLAPHTTTPFDLLFTMGIALAVLGIALIFALVAPGPLRPLAKLGSMPLTIYVAHLLLLLVPFLPAEGMPAFLVHLLVLGAFALVWVRFFARGPLEHLLWWTAGGVGRLVRGQDAPRPRRAIP